VKHHAWLLAGGCLLASATAFAEADADSAAAETSAPVVKAAPVAKTWSPKTSAAKTSAAAKTAKAAPAPVDGPLVVPAAAPTAVDGPLVVPAPAVVPPPVAKPAPAPAPAKPGDWLRKDKAPSAEAVATKQGPSPLRVGGMLLLVATLGGVAFYARRRKQIAKSSAPQGQLRVLGSTRVGPKASAVVVEIAGKRILLGVTEQSVSNLAWLDDEANGSAEVAEDTHVTAKLGSRARGVDDVTAAGPSGFLKLLRNAVGSGAAPRGAAIDEVARTTRDEVRLSSRQTEARVSHRETEELPLEGQVSGLLKRRRDLP
jgi:flagellar biogenesis protein FliO